MLILYRLLTIILTPLIYYYLLRRKEKGKEDILRFNERLGKTTLPRPQGGLIWIHAASVGESLSILPMVNALLVRYPATHIMVTTGTVTSATMLANRLPERVFHQYIPVDGYVNVKRFLHHWKPDAVLWVESELWPNLLTMAAKYCPVILVNARISGHSFTAWQKYPSFIKTLLKSFSLCLPQSENDAAHLIQLGAKNVVYIGNLKYDSPALFADTDMLEALASTTKGRSIWVGASTHANEEEQLAETHKSLRTTHKELLTIIVPRHPQRGTEIAALLKGQHLNVALRSAQEPITASTDIYIADTMGELGIFYRLASIVFIGGSLIPHGGQNPLEAARLDCSIIVGPHMENFVAITQEFLKENACIQVNSKECLLEVMNELLSTHSKQKQLRIAALKVVSSKTGLLDKVVNEIAPYLQKATGI